MSHETISKLRDALAELDARFRLCFSNSAINASEAYDSFYQDIAREALAAADAALAVSEPTALDDAVVVAPIAVSDDPDAHQVRLVVGVQRFAIGDYLETKAEADWYAQMLRHALRKLLQPAPGGREGE